MIITQTPLRLSLLGGNTDFPEYYLRFGGAVITTGIDKYIYCIVKKRFDDEIWINYSQKEKVTKVKHIKHDLVREAMNLVGIDKGIEITFLSDIPSEGSGLGSSSAVTIGVLNALHAYKNEYVDAAQLTDEACCIELDVLHKPIGVQDQCAIAYGGFNLIEFNQDNTFDIKPIDPDGLESHFLLLYTGIQRKSESILSKLDLNTEILDNIKKEVYKKLDHISDPIILGDLLDRYWVMKKKLNGLVTNTDIDALYTKALQNGAWGGKIVGAGGGGFLLLIVPPEKRGQVKEALGLRELLIRFSRYGSRIIFNTHV